MKNLILLLFIPLLFACNSNKESIDKLFKGQTVEPKPNPISNSDSEYSFAATITGNKKLEVKNYYGALRDFDAALAFDYRNELAYCGRGTSYLFLKDYDKAIYNFRIATLYDSTYLEAYFYKVVAHIMLDDLEQACIAWKIIEKIGDKDSRNKWKKIIKNSFNIDFDTILKKCN